MNTQKWSWLLSQLVKNVSLFFVKWFMFSLRVVLLNYFREVTRGLDKIGKYARNNAIKILLRAGACQLEKM